MIGGKYYYMTWSDGKPEYFAIVQPTLQIKYQVESGNPGESKELRNAREKFNRVFGVSLGEEDRLVILEIDLQT